MMRTLAQTGNGWMTFKDASNEKCNQTGATNDDGSARVVHLSNLCTEILEVTDQDNTAVCNLGSLNLGVVRRPGRANSTSSARRVVRQVVPFLDRVIDINYYPTPEAEFSNNKWRPVGLGLMGLQDVFFKKGLAFDSPDAKDLSRRISAHIYFHALWASTDLAEANGAHEAFDGTRAAQGDLQFDLWHTEGRSGAMGVTPPAELDWDALRARIKDVRTAQLTADRHRADRHDRIDRRLLRVHRAAGVEPVQARDALGRVHADQPLPGARTAGTWPVGRADDRRDQAGRRFGPGRRADPRRTA